MIEEKVRVSNKGFHTVVVLDHLFRSAILNFVWSFMFEIEESTYFLCPSVLDLWDVLCWCLRSFLLKTFGCYVSSLIAELTNFSAIDVYKNWHLSQLSNWCQQLYDPYLIFICMRDQEFAISNAQMLMVTACAYLGEGWNINFVAILGGLNKIWCMMNEDALVYFFWMLTGVAYYNWIIKFSRYCDSWSTHDMLMLGEKLDSLFFTTRTWE